jgi:hypothetical protein
MRVFTKIAVLSCFVSLLLVTFSTNAAGQKNTSGTTLFRAINCQVLSPDGASISVFAYRSMKNKDEVILISRNADHSLLVNFKTSKAYKMAKPLLGSNAVTVSDVRPASSGNIGFMARNVQGKKGLTEIIVHFQGESCFLCGPQAFASIWD